MRKELVVVALSFSVTCVLGRSGQLSQDDGGAGGSEPVGGGGPSPSSGGSGPDSSSSGSASSSQGKGGGPGSGGAGGVAPNGGAGGEGGTPLLDCDTLFNDVEGYLLCSELAEECRFVADLGP